MNRKELASVMMEHILWDEQVDCWVAGTNTTTNYIKPEPFTKNQLEDLINDLNLMKAIERMELYKQLDNDPILKERFWLKVLETRNLINNQSTLWSLWEMI